MMSGNPHQKRVVRRLARAASVAMAASLALSGVALAQPSTIASSVTPDSFQPPLQKLNGAVVFSGTTGTEAPPGSEQIGITLSGVDMDGALPQMAQANAALKSRLTSGRVPVSELFNAVGALEEAYANAGFVLVRVVLPQQSLRDGGVLKILVVDGFVETVDNANVPPEVQKRIDRLTSRLVNRKGLTLAELERQLLLAGDVAGVSLGTALGAGRSQGGTVLTLDPEYQRITGFVGFDSHSSKELGPWALNAGVEFNSPFGFGETFYLRASGAPTDFFGSDPRYRVLAAGAVVPIGASGLVLNAEVTTSDTTPKNTLTPTRSNFDRQSLRLVYPWIRSRQLNVTTQVSLDKQQDRQDLIAVGLIPIYEDKTTVLRAGGSMNYLHEDGAFSDVGVVLSRGIDALGARRFADVGAGTPLSRQGSDAVFTKLNISGYHQRALSGNIVLSVTGRAQLSFGDALVTSEQFGLAGPRELSAFDSGELRGDNGWVLRAEVAHQYEASVASTPLIMSPYIFLAAGGISIQQPTIVERGHESAYAYGIGIDLLSKTESSFRASSLRVEMARGERDNGSNDTRFSISGNFRF